MTSIPTSIETYLVEAGFTTTELLVLKNMLAGEPLTLRELAAKTGKSTGVLDVAIKKLAKRKIVSRIVINNMPRFVIPTAKTINQWMQQDVKRKQALLNRQVKDFNSFVNNLENSVSRPKIEHYEGLDGMKKALEKLLNCAHKELFWFIPRQPIPAQDPLQEYRVEFVRARKKRGIISRILMQESAEGRRYKDKDPYLYRETVLVPAVQFKCQFDRCIAGDYIGHFNFAENTASIMKHPELAESERELFNMVWCQYMKNCQLNDRGQMEHDPRVPLNVKICSTARELKITSQRALSVMVMGIVGLLITAVIINW